MYCSSVFSHKELQGKGRVDKHEMLHSVGRNWAEDLTYIQKNGTFYVLSHKEGHGIINRSVPSEYTAIENELKRWLEP